MNLLEDLFAFCDPAKLYIIISFIITIVACTYALLVKKMIFQNVSYSVIWQILSILICGFMISVLCKYDYKMLAILWAIVLSLATLAGVVGVRVL